ncbi:MAG: alpha/beta fold hydrolase [Tibeticola sp.]
MPESKRPSTLARLQRLLLLAWFLLLAAGLAALSSHGHAGLAGAWALLALGGHAIVLAGEFAWMHHANGRDPAPRATMRHLLQAWWGEVTGATRVFGWRQPFRSQRHGDLLQPASRTGVLLLHGFVCNRGLWNPWLERLARQRVPYVALNLEPVFGGIDDYVPRIEAAIASLERCTGRPPVVVAHSMGGLALRRWWIEPGNSARIRHAITIGTPHRGTALARLAFAPNARQMRLSSPWLQALQQAEPPAHAAAMTCFYSHCDNIVFPASMACLPGATHIHLPGVAHVHMTDHPAPWAELMRRLQA